MARLPSPPASYATTLTLPRVYNIAYPGDDLLATANKADATGYVVRRADSAGGYTEVATGAWSGSSMSIGTAGTAPYDDLGHYTLTLTGPDVGDGQYGTDYGTCRFVICEQTALIPDAPLRAASPANVTDGVDAPLAHGVFSLGGFRTGLLAQKLQVARQSEGASSLASTGLTFNTTGGGFDGNTTPNSHVLMIHLVVGDATGMGQSSGYTTIQTSTQGTATVKVYRKYGNQTPASITVSTTNNANHYVWALETVFSDDAALNNGQLLLTPYTGTGSSVEMTADLTALAPGATEYWLTSFVAHAETQAVTSIVSDDMTPYWGGTAYRMDGTVDAFGGGREHTVTYNYGASVNYVGMMIAYKAESTYATDLAATQGRIDAMYERWGQYGTETRPRQMTVQTLAVAAEDAVDRFSGTITQIVTDLHDHEPGFVAGFTGRNEPQADYSLAEAQAFADAVHAVPGAQAFGPDYVSLSFSALHQPDFFDKIDEGLLDHLDGLSYHDYNMSNGDLPGIVRPVMTALRDGLADRDLDPSLMWMTEGGHDTSWSADGGDNGANLLLRHFGSHYMLMTIARELILGVPYERAYTYYDRRAGYDSVTMWNSSDSGPYLGWTLQRAYAREVYDKTVDHEYDFGDAEALYLGGEWRNPTTGGGMAALVAACEGLDDLTCFCSGAESLTVVDAFGNTSTVSVTDNEVTLPVGELPTYVRLPADVVFSPRPQSWGPVFNRAEYHSMALADSGDGSATATALGKMARSTRESSYAHGNSGISTYAYQSTTGTFPRNIDFTLALSSITADKIVVFCPRPWQSQSTLLDFDVQTRSGGVWTTRETFTQSSESVKNFDYNSDTRVDNYSAGRNVFVVDLGSLLTFDGIRLVVREASEGMNLNDAMRENPGDTRTPDADSIVIQSIEAYATAGQVRRPAMT